MFKIHISILATKEHIEANVLTSEGVEVIEDVQDTQETNATQDIEA